VARLAGDGAAADAAWLATAACGIGYALWSAIDGIRHGRVGVDVIALLAVAGAAATRELLAAAVISVMLASRRALEAWADQRARHDLNALLARAPRTARRYRGGSLETVPLGEIAMGDVLLVAPGDVLPVDGAVASGIAVLDESALTGEARPVRDGDAKAQIAPFVRAAARRGLLRRHPMACANLVAGPFDLESQGSLLPSAPDSADVNKPRNQTQTRQ
jgi:cation transport ATPase